MTTSSWSGAVPAARNYAPLPFILAAASSVVTGWLVVEGLVSARALAAGAIALVLIALGLTAPDQMLLVLIAWLAALGVIRRITPGIAFGSDVDFLLAVAPAAFAVLALVAAGRGAFRNRTPLSTAVLAFMAIVALSALNPLQGGLIAGIGGLFFVLVPMLAFWIGRTITDNSLKHILLLFCGLAILASLYGLAQVVHGFLPWDARWIEESGFRALNVYATRGTVGAVRPFSTFSSAAEYAYFLGIGILVLLVYAIKRRRVLVPTLVGALLFVALVYASARIVVVALVAAVALTLAAARRMSLPAAAVATATALVLLPTLLAVAAPSFGGVPAAPLITHQLEGLRDPLNPQASTLPSHLALIKDGFADSIRNPLGVGISTTNIAGQRFAGGTSKSTEADPSNVAVALGMPGLLLYTIIAVLAFLTVYTRARRRHDFLSLVAVGVVTLLFLQWLNGGQYAVAFLPWLMLGWADRQLNEPT